MRLSTINNSCIGYARARGTFHPNRPCVYFIHSRTAMSAATDTLARLVDEGLAYSVEYRDGLSNHEPMVLAALSRLIPLYDLPPDRLSAFAAAYRPRLVRSSDHSSAVPRSLATREQAFGRFDQLDALEASYAAELAERGLEATVRDALVALGPALPAAAGHGLLRVFYAIDVRDALPPSLLARELARGLAYFAARRIVLYDGPRGREGLRAVLTSLPWLDATTAARLDGMRAITDRQGALAPHPLYRAALARITADVDVLAVAADLARVAIANPDFTLLHGLTTAHAILDLQRAWPTLDTTPLRRGLIDFVVAAWLSEALAFGPDGAPAADGGGLAALRDRLCHTTDDHAIKAAYSLHRLEVLSGDPVFAAAACRYVEKYA